MREENTKHTEVWDQLKQWKKVVKNVTFKTKRKIENASTNMEDIEVVFGSDSDWK